MCARSHASTYAHARARTRTRIHTALAGDAGTFRPERLEAIAQRFGLDTQEALDSHSRPQQLQHVHVRVCVLERVRACVRLRVM